MSITSNEITISTLPAINKIDVTVSAQFLSAYAPPAITFTATAYNGTTPIPGVPMTVYIKDEVTGNETQYSQGKANASGQVTGSYTFSNNGNFTVYVVSGNVTASSFIIYVGATLSIGASTTTPDINVSFAISGTLADYQGNGIDLATIQLTDVTTGTKSTSSTDSAGAYSFGVTLTATGSYSFSAEALP